MATAIKKDCPKRTAGEQRAEDLEAGSELFVVIAYHYAQWSGDGGEYEYNILDEDDCDEIIVGAFTSERLYRIGVEAYFEEFKPDLDGNGPINSIGVFQTTLNQHGTGPNINGFDAHSGWRIK